MAAEPARKIPAAWEICALTVSALSMTQLIFGAALGFLLGEGVLYGVKYSIGWLQRGEVRKRVGKLSSVRGTELIGGFIKYAGVIGAIGALIALGVWGVGDYLAAKSVHRVMSANTSDAAVTASTPDPHSFSGDSCRSQPGSSAGETPDVRRASPPSRSRSR